MGSVYRKCFAQKAAAKTKLETRRTPSQKQQQTLCKVCGKPVHGGKPLCGSCSKYILQKRKEEEPTRNSSSSTKNI